MNNRGATEVILDQDLTTHTSEEMEDNDDIITISSTSSTHQTNELPRITEQHQ